MKYDVSLTVETASLLAEGVQKEIEQRLRGAPDLLFVVDYVNDKYTMDMGLALGRVVSHFKNTPFEYGFSHAHDIAFGIGWGSAVLKMMYIDFGEKTIQFKKCYSSPLQDVIVTKEFKVLSECFKLLPLTEAKFDTILARRRT